MPDPLSDMTDEVAAYNVEFLFLDRNTANRVANGDFGVDWFKRTQLKGYPQLAGREESLSLNTSAATFMKYTNDSYLKSLINRKSSNANLNVRDVFNASNSLDIKGQKPLNYVSGNWLSR